MRKTGIADLPLHWGKAPSWLFRRMVKLTRRISELIIREYGSEEFLRRIADPYFFQALGCVIGWDWHSSGLTTTLCGALKEARMEDLGIFVLGGKGTASRNVPNELKKMESFDFDKEELNEMKKISRLVAKIDNCLIQDGYQLYHHTMIVSEDLEWAVIQQGMNVNNRYARRYHWLSADVRNFFEEPHKAICGVKQSRTLNLVSKQSRETRKCMLDLVNDGTLLKWIAPRNSLVAYLKLPRKHLIEIENYKSLVSLKGLGVSSFEELINTKGVGTKTIRALALVSHLIYGTKLSWKDPVSFSFAHGGKDGTPYRVDRRVYDKTIEFLEDAIKQLSLGKKEKINMLKRLQNNFKLK